MVESRVLESLSKSDKKLSGKIECAECRSSVKEEKKVACAICKKYSQGVEKYDCRVCNNKLCVSCIKARIKEVRSEDRLSCVCGVQITRRVLEATDSSLIALFSSKDPLPPGKPLSEKCCFCKNSFVINDANKTNPELLKALENNGTSMATQISCGDYVCTNCISE